MNAPAAALLEGSEYPSALRTLIDQATRRVWIVQFLIDTRPEEDRGGEVRYLLHALAEAAARGVEVRVVLPRVERGGTVSHDMNEAPAQFLANRGVEVRRLVPREPRPHCHMKLVQIDDDWAVVGNANWTPSAFRINEESSVVLRDGRAASRLRRVIERLSSNAIAVEPLGPIGSPLPWVSTDASSCNGVQRIAPVRLRRGRYYWPARRRPSDPFELVRPAGEAALGRLGPVGGLQLLAGQRYLHRMGALIDGAQQRAWISMFGLRASRTARMRPLLTKLQHAVERGVDVRILFEGSSQLPGLWEADLGVMRALGLNVRPWPLASRLHCRSVLVDDTIVQGSVGWTPRSMFRTDEVSVELRGGPPSYRAASSFARRWHLASTSPDGWPAECAGGATLVREQRLPPCVAAVLVDAGVASLDELSGLTVDGIDERLQQAYPPGCLRDLVPAAAFIASVSAPASRFGQPRKSSHAPIGAR